MKLSYCGISYKAEPLTLEVTEGEIYGIYRGQHWRVHKPTLLRRRYIASLELSYRGSAYQRQVGS
jgi:hypothetical protein